MVSPNLSEIITTTLRDRAQMFADNVTEKNALLRKLKERGNIRIHSGGRTIVRELDYAENSTFQYYSGYEVLNTDASDVLSAAEYSWRQASVSVLINGLEERQNSGEAAVLDLLESRIRNAMRTMSNNISDGVYSDGTGTSGKQIDGLQAIVADSPATGTVGGINAANFAFWRNFSFDATTDGGAAASATNIIGYMNTVYNTVIRGTDKPDLIPADLNYFGFYQDALQSQQRFTNDNAKGGADGGFVELMYASAPVILDDGSGIPTNHMYFLNTEFLSLDVHEDANFTPRGGKESFNQDATLVPVIFMGNLTCSNRERQGVLTD
ncbi:MAG: phage major capsid protein [Candidatus Bathyarchaeia archaeon]